MDNATNEQYLEKTGNIEFANPKLAEIIESVEVKTAKSYWKSTLYEIGSWLIIPITSVVTTILVFNVWAALAILFFKIIPTMIIDEKTVEIFSPDLVHLADVAIWNIPLIYQLLLFLIYITILVPVMIILSYNIYLVSIEKFFKTRRWAKRYRLDALSKLAKSEKNPILYLRSFRDDKNEDDSRRTLRTFEEDLTSVLKFVGPVVAIGQIYDDISPLGATRVYIKTEEWKENVKSLMQFSQLIVIHAGTSKSLLWEIKTAIKTVEPKKLLIAFLSWEKYDEEYRENEYRKFKELFESELVSDNKNLTTKLPATLGEAKFIVFDQQWNSALVKTNRSVKSFYRFSEANVISETLKPVLAERKMEISKSLRLNYFIFLIWLILGTIFVFPLIVFMQFYEKMEFFQAISDFPFLGLIFNILLLVFYLAGSAAYFIVFNWIISKILELIYFLTDLLLGLFGKIVPSQGSGLQESIGFVDRD